MPFSLHSARTSCASSPSHLKPDSFLPQLLQTPPEAGYGFGASITESGRLLLPSAVASFLVGFAQADHADGGGAAHCPGSSSSTSLATAKARLAAGTPQ